MPPRLRATAGSSRSPQRRARWKEAVGLGFYKAEVYGPEYPKLQILIRRGGKG